jgi:outer membrane lipoprotein carrier protein
MKKVFLFSLLLFDLVLVQAQTKPKSPVTPPKESSDPATKVVLDKVKAKYEAYKTIEADFSLTLEFPQQAKEVQKGKLLQKGNKYRMDFNQQTVLSDGKAVWMILPKNKEVQINDLPDPNDDETILSPQALFRIYLRKDFIYSITNEYAQGKRVIQEIEFKPTGKYSEYSKLRLSIDKKTLDFIELKAFGKDGSRYTLVIASLTPNKPLADASFSFNKANYPGYHVEDLRNR